MFIYRNFLLFYCAFWAAQSVAAQGFLHTYAPENSVTRAVFQTSDGGYFIAGRVTASHSVFVVRTNAPGQTLWSKQISLNDAEGVAACLSPDDGAVILAENYLDAGVKRNAILKLDASGTILWSTVVASPLLPNGLKDIIALPDGSFLAAGVTRDIQFNARNWLVKIAPDGALLWQKSFGKAAQNIKRLIKLPNGEGVAVSGNDSDLYLAKLDLDGELIWEKSYPLPGNQTNYDLLNTTDGNIALLATTPDMALVSQNVSVLKTDLNGAQLWHKNYYPFPTPFISPYLPVLSSFAQDGAGNFYIPLWGFLDDPSASDLGLLKLSPDGTALGKTPLQVSGNIWDIFCTADQQLVMTGDNNGFPTNAMLLKTDLEGTFLSNKIMGHVYRDNDLDCTLTAGETGLGDFVVKASNANGEAYFKKTNPDGSYEVKVTSGDFAISVRPALSPASFYTQCDTPSVSVSGTGQVASAPDIMEQVLVECPYLTVEVSGGILRRCTPVTYNVTSCNTGNQPVWNTLLQLAKPPHLIYQSSNLPLLSQTADTLTFDLGYIPAGGCESLNIQCLVDCATEVGDIFCMEAYISPDTACVPPDFDWDGSEIEVSGVCNGSEIEFTIKNTGTGNMAESADYVIIEDEIMYTQNAIQLNAGQEMTTVRMPMPDDSCFALQVFPNQRARLRRPVAVVANCTATGNLNLLLSLPNNENDPTVAIHCDEIVGSFDPNDKVGFPQGLTPAHYIERGQDIEYRIRFQNTGNDTAFLVVVRDTLPLTLDPATIRPQAASHPYTWDLTDEGALSFRFDNILLPDSTTNEPGSHGFVSFLVSQKPDLPDGTLLDNAAAIYFDFNEAIQTNTWEHTIGRPLTVPVYNLPGQGRERVRVAPNPVQDEAMFELQGLGVQNTLCFKLFDAYGKVMQVENCAGAQFSWKRNKLPPGVYFWQFEAGNQTLSRGKLVLK